MASFASERPHEKEQLLNPVLFKHLLRLYGAVKPNVFSVVCINASSVFYFVKCLRLVLIYRRGSSNERRHHPCYHLVEILEASRYHPRVTHFLHRRSAGDLLHRQLHRKRLVQRR